MNKAQYRKLLLLVNDRDQMDLLQEYVASRVEGFRDLLEKQKDPQRILEIQGAITELRRFKTLRDEVIKGAE
jgi:hypothetical protein